MWKKSPWYLPTFLLVDSFHRYIAVFMTKGRVSADFKKRVDSLWKYLLRKEEGIDPTLLHKVVYKFNEQTICIVYHSSLFTISITSPENPGNGYKRSRHAKSQWICPQSSKTLFMNTVKKSRLIELILSRIFLLWIQAQYVFFLSWKLKQFVSGMKDKVFSSTLTWSGDLPDIFLPCLPSAAFLPFCLALFLSPCVLGCLPPELSTV